ncbi:related to E3 SUMO-protein ligase pli1 [Rhynchosporium agropyri]|uniref:Related to E3 SUMO-protein ligase pli1 n=1 Tax=Rhynchosporium agropyri TaxID=914238 RepID=A0A1E1L5W8_9HELO|nr:related to E3 SUMO-protein ligase pli1 [Rhynchosporium agropyri]
MASMGAGYLDVEPLVRQVKYGGYVNKLLQNICASEGLSKLGVKADLQQRIIDKLQHYVKTKNTPAYQRLKSMIEHPSTILPQAGMASASSSVAGTPVPPSPYLGLNGPYNTGGGASCFRPLGHPRIEFKSSPYFDIQEQIGNPSACEVMTQHRHTVKMIIRPQDYPILSKASSDETLRVMVFCAGETAGRQDISFPHQSEIKVNGGEVKANLRGLKNKPGSTRPVDITKELRFNPQAYSNSVEMTYALTNKKFYLIIYVVKAVLVADLVQKLSTGKRISEAAVLEDMRSKARDTDIVATASALSLKCPLSTLRIDLPCRSIACRHNQCFDATSYLQLQEQGPTWLCPICNNPAPFEHLAVDEYVQNILKQTSKSIDQVIIQPDGKWELNARKKDNPQPSRPSDGVASDSDDDLVEITKSGDNVRMGTPRVAPSLPTNGTPSHQSREQSSSSSVPARDSLGSTSGKRPISAVIDLTSSGDEEDEPIARQPKRQFTGNGYGAPSASTPVYRPPPPPSLTYPSR